MITKTQWDEFCSHVYLAKIIGLNPFLHGRRVIEIDLNKKEIVTIKQGEPNTRYKHPDSFDNYKNLNYLHSTISFEKLTLKQVINFSNNLHKNNNKIYKKLFFYLKK